MRTPGADSIDLTRKVYMMSTKTHVVAPIMMAVTVAAAMGIALAPPGLGSARKLRRQYIY